MAYAKATPNRWQMPFKTCSCGRLALKATATCRKQTAACWWNADPGSNPLLQQVRNDYGDCPLFAEFGRFTK